MFTGGNGFVLEAVFQIVCLTQQVVQFTCLGAFCLYSLFSFVPKWNTPVHFGTSPPFSWEWPVSVVMPKRNPFCGLSSSHKLLDPPRLRFCPCHDPIQPPQLPENHFRRGRLPAACHPIILRQKNGRERWGPDRLANVPDGARTEWRLGECSTALEA
jgi:hypothetical protein